MIEIKLLNNKRYKAINEEALIVQGEENATMVKVEFPEGTDSLHKRVDFRSSNAKKVSLGLYTPTTSDSRERLNFCFSIPNDMTSSGELRMQFVAYVPDSENTDKTVVYYEPIILWVSEGIARLRNNSENEDLVNTLTKLTQKSLEAADSAKKSASQSLDISREVGYKTDKAVATANDALEIIQEAERQSEEAVRTARGADRESQKAVNTANAATVIAAKAVEESNEAVKKSIDAKKTAKEAVDTAQNAYGKSAQAFSLASSSNLTSKDAKEVSDRALSTSQYAQNRASEAVSISLTAESNSNQAVAESTSALQIANKASSDASVSVGKSQRAESLSEQANELSNDAVSIAQSANTTAGSALANSEEAIATSRQAESQAQSVVDRANSGEFKGEKGDKGDKGQDGFTFTINNLVGFNVRDDGGFYAYTSEASSVDFRYDEETGELYLVYQ